MTESNIGLVSVALLSQSIFIKSFWTKCFLNGPLPVSFIYFRLFNTVDNVHFENDWIRTSDLWCRKRPLYQQCYKHCTKMHKMFWVWTLVRTIWSIFVQQIFYKEHFMRYIWNNIPTCEACNLNTVNYWKFLLALRAAKCLEKIEIKATRPIIVPTLKDFLDGASKISRQCAT